MPDETRKSEIIAVAWRLFQGAGYAGTTMNDIVRKSGASRRTVYRLFPGKIDLFGAMIENHRRTMLALPGDYDGLPISEALERIFQIDIPLETERERNALMGFFIGESRQNPELGELMRKNGIDRSFLLLSDWIERQASLGRIRVRTPHSAAQMLMDIVFGAVSLKIGDGPQWPGGKERKSYLKSCIAMVVDGLAP